MSNDKSKKEYNRLGAQVLYPDANISDTEFSSGLIQYINKGDKYWNDFCIYENAEQREALVDKLQEKVRANESYDQVNTFKQFLDDWMNLGIKQACINFIESCLDEH